MQINIEKNIGQTACRTSAFIGGGKWRVLAWQLLLMFVVFFSLAGREAQAVVVSAEFSGDFAAANPTFNINETPKIEGSCTQQNWQWTRDITAVEIYSGKTRLSRNSYGDGSVDWEESYSEELSFDALGLAPEGTYKAVTGCRASFGLQSEFDSKEKFFTIRPLTGSYTAKMDPSNKLIVEGTVGNGADEVRVYRFDENGSEIELAKATGLTSGFKIETQLEPRKYELRVYAYYDQHYKRIGTTTVYPKPTITLGNLPPVTNDPKILLKGSASSPVGIARVTFDRHVDLNLSTREEGPFVVPSPARENVTFEHEFNVQDDGTHRFTAWAYGTDNVYTESAPRSILLDRKPPEIEILSHADGSYIKNNTRLLIKATDLAPSGKPGSGIQSVTVEFVDGSRTLGWKDATLKSGSTDEYSVEIPFDQLQPGSISVNAWAKDKAGNEVASYLKAQYKKSALPTASITPPASPTRNPEITINGAAHADAGLKKISLTWWKDGKTATKQSAVLKFSAGDDADVSHAITLPDDGHYQFELSVQAQDGQTAVSAPQTVLLDATKPTITILSPAPDSTHEEELKLAFTVEDAGTGVNDIQIRLGDDSAPWIKNIPINAAGKYSHVLPLDEVDAGTLRVTIWAVDKAGNQQWKYASYVKQEQRRFSAAQALALTLDMIAPPVSGQTDPTLTAATVAQQAPFVYRVVLSAQKQSVEEASLRYRLPGGLSPAGSPSVLVDATKQVKLNPSWDGDANDELLDAKTMLAPSQTITIDIPVAVKEQVEDGVAVQSTVNAGAGNLIDALSAKHTVKVRERQRGGDQVMVVKSSDAKASVQPGANIVYRIRVSNQTSRIARNLLIRDRAPDHTTLLSSSCGELSPETCKTYLLNDSDIVEDQMTHDALCTTPGRKSAPDGRHVIWCLNGDLAPLDEYVVDYTIQVNGTAPPP
jgi:hypothetical protein